MSIHKLGIVTLLILLAPSSAGQCDITWRQVNRSGPAAVRAGLDFDRERDVFVMFGGKTNDPIFAAQVSDETWEWDGVGSWNQVAAFGPPARQDSELVYDRANDVMVLYGGNLDSNSLGNGLSIGDHWTFDGTIWTQLPDPPSLARHGHEMVYDTSEDVILVYGGRKVELGFGDAYFGETWKLSGSVWTTVANPLPNPGPRTEHCMAYDSARERAVVFGGWAPGSLGGPNGETWEWDGTFWAMVATVGPPMRRDATMVYDEARGVCVLTGGRSIGLNPNRLLRDTWEWDGTSWTERGSSVPSRVKDRPLSMIRSA